MEQSKIIGEAADSAPAKSRQLCGRSKNPIIFNDYDSYVAKFTEPERTTDDTFTPRDVFEAVLDYVRSIYPMDGKTVLRPFYPGGDYEHAEYPPNGVVVDNPPFSIFIKIVRFYSEREIPFFLFAPGLTLFNVLPYCSAVIINRSIVFHNGAVVNCSFATNLIGDTLVTTAVELDKAIGVLPSQKQTRRLNKYAYPPELMKASTFEKLVRNGQNFSVKRDEVAIINNLDNLPKYNLFGGGILVSRKVAADVAGRPPAADTTIHIALSEREQRIVDRLGAAPSSIPSTPAPSIPLTEIG